MKISRDQTVTRQKRLPARTLTTASSCRIFKKWLQNQLDACNQQVKDCIISSFSDSSRP